MFKLNRTRGIASLLLVVCLLATPLTVFARKGEKNFKKGLEYETAQQWEKAAQEFTLAVAAAPSNIEYQLHYRRALFNASQQFMQQGRAMADQQDYIGAYNAYRQANMYDPVNELALREMEKMVRLQKEKEEASGAPRKTGGAKITQTSFRDSGSSDAAGQSGSSQEPTRSFLPRGPVNFKGDLQAFIRLMAEQINLNVIFDSQLFRTPRPVDVSLKDVTIAYALDLILLQENLFFQRLGRRTILIADQTRRGQYQQLVLRTFYLENIDPTEFRNFLTSAIPASQGRPNPVVIADKATNSITVRDTAENVQLMADLIKAMDKDRAEVVMDVSIFEVSRNDLLQIGNQVGKIDGSTTVGGSPGLSVLSSSGSVNGSQGGVNLSSILGSTPTALAAALMLPPSALTIFQSKGRSKLIASTQVHAFNNEESTARIGNRVPVQTASAFPFGTTTGTTQPGQQPGNVFNGGYPVIQYEQTGLTLKFTPQVFPNQDVQVKMTIEEKDVAGSGSLTPIFTERTIQGTARIQNNRTMLLASVSTDRQSTSRAGLPLLGLIPILGRLFTAPKDTNDTVDIVIAVTPRVIRAPQITPSDLEMRFSGSLLSPTSGSLEAVIQDIEREERIAAAEERKRDAVAKAQEQPTFVPAPSSDVSAQELAQANGGVNAPPINAVNSVQAAANSNGSTTESPKPLLQDNGQQVSGVAAAVNQLVNGATTRQTVDTKPQNSSAALPVNLAERIKASVEPRTETNPVSPTTSEPAPASSASVAASMSFISERAEMRVGEKQRVAVVIDSPADLDSILLKLKFDPRVIAIRNVLQVDVGAQAASMSLMQMIDREGSVVVSLSSKTGSPMKSGATIIFFLEVEATGVGESDLSFDREQLSLQPANKRTATVGFVNSRLLVKK